jgi:hypothetical protein
MHMMESYMSTFNAVGIEHTLGLFFGKQIGSRGEIYDADIFRAGEPKDLAEILRRVADRLEQRLARITFPIADEPRVDAKSQVDGAIVRLRAIATQTAERPRSEPEDYHWEIFGALMMLIAGLLLRLEDEAELKTL